ncbi:MAG: hypothetical protein Tsb0013_17390 [Phycisphaerales bacterium]
MSDVFSNANDLRVARTELLLRIPPREAFAYFADPHHLVDITPPWHSLHVACPRGSDWVDRDARFEVTLIIHGHGAEWNLRYSVWEPHKRFMIEQVDGPYTEYRHERIFEPIPGGTRVLERIEYAHLGGSLYQRLIIQPELEMLFSYRHRRILEKFGLEALEGDDESSSVTHATG